jgi:DNA-binding NarL/FixJ family response regulator
MEAIARAEQLRPDVVIMDVAMPIMNGIEATRLIRKKYPETRVLILTQHEDPQYILPLLQAGASGIVLKRALVADLITALRVVARGETFLDPTMANVVAENIGRQAEPSGAISESLTPREQEVLEHIVKGETNPQIAVALSVSVKTVEWHRTNLMSKLGIHTIAGLVRYALEHVLAGKRTSE